MISEQEALAAILASVPEADGELVPLVAACGRFAVRDVIAGLALPSFDNSAMDGWALHANDCGRTGVPLRVAGEQPAGASRGLTVRPGETVRIFTGAPIPAGTAAVVMQEDTDRDGEFVRVREAAAPGELIRRAGIDVCAGQVLVRKGEPLTPQRIGVLAAQGMTEVHCGRQPRAAIVCTGDELIAPGEPLPHAGSLYNSNGPMLAALLASSRTVAAATVDTVNDDLVVLTNTLRQRLAENDVLMIAGGVSVGEHDLVKPALKQLGIAPEFWRVSVKPGKPFLFCAAHGKLIFGLPGNPVSAFVTATLFVLPALRRMAGASQPAKALMAARTLSDLENGDVRTCYFRGCHDAAAGTFQVTGTQESHAVAGLSRANALARLEGGAKAPAGGIVSVLWLAH